MKIFINTSPAFVMALVFIFLFSFTLKKENPNPDGAWILDSKDEQQVLIFADGYFTHTAYHVATRKFYFTQGGPFHFANNVVEILQEFNTRNKEVIGNTLKISIALKGNKLIMNEGTRQLEFVRLDEGKENLAGLWKITARKQGDAIAPIHQTGSRKTIKILSGTRFQWAAINPATKEFSGTGGGTYTFKNGKYTEHIEFFSRDSSRVGASLSFDGKIENNDWHHSGFSSKGDAIYEIWSRP